MRVSRDDEFSVGCVESEVMVVSGWKNKVWVQDLHSGVSGSEAVEQDKAGTLGTTYF